MIWLGNTLGYKTIEDWYQITAKDFINNGGSSLLHKEGSIQKIIEKMFPDKEWLPWKFSSLNMGFWANKEQVRKYVEFLEEKLNIKVGKIVGIV